MREGFPVIIGMLAGMPAELSGQLHPGDSVVAVAQGNEPFVQTQGLALSNFVAAIRGQPGTMLRMQVMASDAATDPIPREISIVRSQIKYKR